MNLILKNAGLFLGSFLILTACSGGGSNELSDEAKALEDDLKGRTFALSGLSDVLTSCGIEQPAQPVTPAFSSFLKKKMSLAAPATQTGTSSSTSTGTSIPAGSPTMGSSSGLPNKNSPASSAPSTSAGNTTQDTVTFYTDDGERHFTIRDGSTLREGTWVPVDEDTIKVNYQGRSALVDIDFTSAGLFISLGQGEDCRGSGTAETTQSTPLEEGSVDTAVGSVDPACVRKAQLKLRSYACWKSGPIEEASSSELMFEVGDEDLDGNLGYYEGVADFGSHKKTESDSYSIIDCSDKGVSLDSGEIDIVFEGSNAIRVRAEGWPQHYRFTGSSQCPLLDQ